MSRTDTIKQRRVDVYLDSMERKEEWEEAAREMGMSLSRFVQHCVEDSLGRGGPDLVKPSLVEEKEEEIEELEDSISELRRKIDRKNKVIERLEDDLRKRRMEPFLDGEFEGVRRYEKELIEILKENGWHSDSEILRRLKVNLKDEETLRAIRYQLERLERYGLVKTGRSGWKWKG
ncbi:hypothetical protein AKJ47_00610 [candidate division MSBL1 archaeon SCGC-AAA261G05]|uniref:Uncharacterized protein n=3 Tax=candidate division MSBL1 TaxID=215777 RepID=A0A133V151_9EURY|nr:hypothetical protein AKJ42_01585 [candidate division MSBL1 archaeon SCGC-AAA261C02]KXB04134.1 hypothetical protein AKJ47_00610 [candidate division MSBL1 archaeon SCGC-AAA261G05]KXB05028.1 hypothetical protein AKJ48_00480 [candidate division MSBL1 archaeon SCGC-AAA261O19]